MHFCVFLIQKLHQCLSYYVMMTPFTLDRNSILVKMNSFYDYCLIDLSAMSTAIEKSCRVIPINSWIVSKTKFLYISYLQDALKLPKNFNINITFLYRMSPYLFRVCIELS